MEINIKLQALIIDDETDICFLLSHILKSKNISSRQANSLFLAKEALNTYLPHFVFLDNHLPDGLGVDFIKYVKTLLPETKVIIISANDKWAIKEKALNEGASDFISKPFTVERIYSAIESKQVVR